MNNSWERKLTNSTCWVKLVNWEFWNFYVVYALVMVYYVGLSIKARSWYWFAASNPGIESGGLIGEQKSKILELIPGAYTPPYFKVSIDISIEEIERLMNEKSISYPFIAKPDIGERGRGVAKIENKTQLVKYHQSINVTYIIQAFVDLPLELGIFYYRFPNEEKGTVSSIVSKEFLKVKGDGNSTLRTLIVANPRARFRQTYLFQKFEDQLEVIVPKGKEIVLENIGNHVRGTTFLDANYLRSEAVDRVFDTISKQVKGFYYGRYDIRCSSESDFVQGRNIQIMELNGAGAEPAHIYQPGFSFWEGQKVLLAHWKVMYQISRINHSMGAPYVTRKEANHIVKNHKEKIASIGAV